MHRRSYLAQLYLLKRPRHLACRIPAVPGMDEQTVERKVGLIAGTEIGKLGDNRVFECSRRVADFSKTINSAGSRKAVRDTLDSIQRGRQPPPALLPRPDPAQPHAP